MEYDDATALRLFGRSKRGKVAGPFGDTTNIFIDTAVAVCGISKRRKFATQVDRFLEKVRQGKVHVQAVDGFAACAFAAINKSDTDPSKKCQIGASTGPQPFAKYCIAAYYQSKTAELILPKNCCVTVDNACPLLAFTSQENLFKNV